MSLENNSTNNLSITEAAAAGDLLTVRKIIDEGGDVDERDAEGCTALLHAVRNCHNRIVQELLTSNANAEFRDSLGLSALHVACLKGNLMAVQLLLNYGCDPNGALHPRAPPPISFAMKGNEDIIPCLISCGADVLYQRGIGEVPLMKAVATGDVSLLKKMLIDGKPDLSFTNRDGNNIFEYWVKTFTVRNSGRTHCALLETLLDYAKQTETQLATTKQALTKAMPCLIRDGCMECFNKALPLVNVNHKYDRKGTTMLQIAMTSATCWPSGDTDWTLRETNRLDDWCLEMSVNLLEAGASISAVKENVVGKPWNEKDMDTIQIQQRTILAYGYYIQAWGGWYGGDKHSEAAFRKFAEHFMDDSARLVCWAGYKPSERDLNSLPSSRKSLMRSMSQHGAIEEEDNLIEELRTQFALNPRTLVNLATISVRRQLCDCVLYKVKALHLPQVLQDYVTLKFIIGQRTHTGTRRVRTTPLTKLRDLLSGSFLQ